MRVVVMAVLVLAACSSNDAAPSNTARSAVTEIGSLNNCVEAITDEGTAAATDAVTSGDASAIQRTIDACAPAETALEGELRDLVGEHQTAAADFVGAVTSGTATVATAAEFNADTLRWFERVEAAAQATLGA